MSENRAATIRQLAEQFVEAYNDRDLDKFEAVFHPDFTWHIAVTEPGNPTIRPLQSKLLHGMNLSWDKSIYNKAETIEIFRTIFETTSEFTIHPHSFIVDGNRAAVEAVGNARNQDRDRQYNNIYCYVFEERDGQLVLFREYQDTLLLFDAWVAD